MKTERRYIAYQSIDKVRNVIERNSVIKADMDEDYSMSRFYLILTNIETEPKYCARALLGIDDAVE